MTNPIVHVCWSCTGTLQYCGYSIPLHSVYLPFPLARITGKVYEAPEIRTLSPFLTLSR